jgi:hypothetical protein
MITTPYRNPKRFKDEIEKGIKESLEMGLSFLFVSCTIEEERWHYKDVHRLQGTKQEDHKKLIPNTLD